MGSHPSGPEFVSPFSVAIVLRCKLDNYLFAPLPDGQKGKSPTMCHRIGRERIRKTHGPPQVTNGATGVKCNLLSIRFLSCFKVSITQIICYPWMPRAGGTYQHICVVCKPSWDASALTTDTISLGCPAGDASTSDISQENPPDQTDKNLKECQPGKRLREAQTSGWGEGNHRELPGQSLSSEKNVSSGEMAHQRVGWREGLLPLEFLWDGAKIFELWGETIKGGWCHSASWGKQEG